MAWGRIVAAVLVTVLVAQTQGALAGAPPDLTIRLPNGPVEVQADGVPERWVLGEERIEGQTATIAERLRVLPGARLLISGSTLTFAAHAAGLTGIVAEPGSEVRIASSTLQGASFLVHLEGDAVVDQSRILGAARVVLQPRSLTDHVDEPLGAQLERQAAGWRVARTLTNGSALLQGSIVEAPLIVGVPIQYQASFPATMPAVRIASSLVRHLGAGATLTCYVTRQAPDPDFGLPIPLLGGEESAQFDLVSTVLETGQGPALNCPPSPQSAAMPARNLPLLDPALVAAVNALLPAPPVPEAEAGPALVSMEGGAVAGDGIGILLDGPTRLEGRNVRFDGLDIGLLSQTSSASLVDPLGSGLAAAFRVTGGALTVQGGDLSGRGEEVGLSVAGGAGAVSLTGTRLAGFAVGAAMNGAATLDQVTLEGARYQCVKVEGTPITLRSSTLRGCGLGVHLIEATGATIQDNAFLANGDPLRVESPGVLAHFQHTVTGNTVHARSLSYLVQANGAVVQEPVGHLVIAFTNGATYTDVELSHGRTQIVASTNVVLGATTGNTPGLLAALDPAALPSFQRVAGAVRYEPYAGALRGPQGTLDEGVGNDLDQAWALVDLLRAQGKEARFVDGTFRIDTDAYLNWVGMEHAGYAYGMPGFRGTWFGSFAVMERTWVELTVAPGLRISLDPAFEQYDRLDPVDVAALAGVDLDAPFEAGGLDPGAALDYATHSIANVNLSAAIDAFEANNASIGAFIAANPGLTPRELLGGAVPRPVAASEEPSQRVVLARYDTVPVADQWSVRIRTTQPGVNPAYEAEFWGTSPSMYGKKFNVESAPSDETEAAQLSAAGGYYEAERANIELTTYFFLGDRAVAADGAIPQADGSFLLPDSAAQRTVHRRPGDLVTLAIEVRAPGNVTFNEKHSAFRIGGTYAVALSIGRPSAPLMERLAGDLQENMDLLRNGPSTTLVPTHQLMGALYYFHGMTYFGMVRGVTEPLARSMDIVALPAIDVAVTGTSLVPIVKYNATLLRNVETTYSTPPYIDVQGREFVVHERGDQGKAAEYLFAATVHGSNMEDKVFAGLYSTPSVSTVKVLNVAMAQGMRIYHLNTSEAPDVLPHLTGLPSHVYNSIVRAVNNGLDVVTTGSSVTYLDWTGVGWIEYDADTGASGFLISGGTAPPTNAGTLAPSEPVILSGGAGARFIIFSDNPGDRFDWGYVYGDNTVIDWSKSALGATLDWGEKQTYQAYMDASKLYRGKALNNAQRSLAGSIDLPVRSAKFLGTAGIVLDVGVAGIEIYDVWMDPGLSQSDRIVTTGGIAALTVAEIAVGGIAVAKGAGAGALIGGVIGDGPGVVIGAVVGGAVAAVATGFLFDGVKKWLFG